MTKRIETIEDLAEISGTAAAELKQQKGKTANTKAAKRVSAPLPTGGEVIEVDTPKRERKAQKEEGSSTKPAFDAFAHIDFEEIKARPNPISSFIMGLTKSELIEEIEYLARMTKHCDEVWDKRQKDGDNSIGFKLVAINTARSLDQCQRRLKQLEESS